MLVLGLTACGTETASTEPPQPITETATQPATEPETESAAVPFSQLPLTWALTEPDSIGTVYLYGC